ncbi:rhodanese-like domain-containing protein [Rossellomorea vietnamensis]|uniref:Rhodanese-like domain-containing protein n=3 Tax=Bacillaceae TaxID=186817 RepID=A0A5D4KCF2_9BACI|nr:rhodanese-like domain-containing protein [Rossellomorea vietnamensis]TYS79820.1 rhodanese-like domain-containing protein [Rossellomorea aquimaris]
MEYMRYILVGILVIIIIMRLMPARGVRHITTADLENELQDKDKMFIDVRTKGEFNKRNIQGFKNIPLYELPYKTKELTTNKEIVLMCQSGTRSNKAAKILKKKGFSKVANVKGGMGAWSK